jgi:DNA primase
MKPREQGEDRPKPVPSVPSSAWQAKAGAFLARCQGAFKTNRAALDWLRGRGLKPETIEAAGFGWNPVERYEDREAWGLEPLRDEKGNVKKLWLPAGLVIPLQVNDALLRLRIRRPQGEPRYVIVSGSDMKPMNLNLDRKHFVIVESELDGLLIEQEAGDMAGVVALGSAQAKPNQELKGLLKRAFSILVSLDFDEAGAKAAWKFWLETYPNAKRWPTPYGKDPSDAAQKGLNIRAWVEAGLTPGTFTEQSQRSVKAIIKPFSKEWLQKYDETILERLAIMTVDGRLSDQEATRILN